MKCLHYWWLCHLAGGHPKVWQTIFVTEELNEQVFAILEECICKNKKATGSQGMILWHILVLSLVGYAYTTNWYKLHHYANNDMTMRNIMGLHNNEFGEGFHEFEYQNIRTSYFCTAIIQQGV